MKAALKALRAGKVVGIFPQGGIREADMEFDDGKGGVALLALKTAAPVIPFYISGSAHESVFRSLVTPSRSRVHCGNPFALVRDGSGKPSRRDLQAMTRKVLDSIAAQKPQQITG